MLDTSLNLMPDNESDALACLLKEIAECKSEDQQCPKILTHEEETGLIQQSSPQGTVVGPTPAELESLNELIKFDHVYYKTHSQDNSGQNSHISLCQNSPSIKSTPSNMTFTIIKGNKSHSIQVYVTADEKKKDSATLVPNQSAVSLLKNNSLLASNNTVVGMDQCKPVKIASQLTESDILVEEMGVINPLSLDMDSILEVGELNMDLLEDLESILKEDCESIAHSSAPVPSPQIQKNEKPMDSIEHGTRNSVTKGVKRKHGRSVSASVPCLSVENLITSVLSPGEVDRLSDSGISCDLSDAVSPYSQYSDINEFPSSPLQDSPWEESFQELFPDLV
ncbi:hypothetical protein CHS0354_003695 [Potamilus streckersoni]|uniref:Uncharacterized protein n=1 Tax=Potamilus streckersoni TaxID=2493646 RepID=A0AAE0W1V1_9BIVA|nr:hypothetical protein CHS0354_003695 [Potamilus streckersoni]